MVINQPHLDESSLLTNQPFPTIVQIWVCPKLSTPQVAVVISIVIMVAIGWWRGTIMYWQTHCGDQPTSSSFRRGAPSSMLSKGSGEEIRPQAFRSWKAKRFAQRQLINEVMAVEPPLMVNGWQHLANTWVNDGSWWLNDGQWWSGHDCVWSMIVADGFLVNNGCLRLIMLNESEWFFIMVYDGYRAFNRWSWSTTVYDRES